MTVTRYTISLPNPDGYDIQPWTLGLFEQATEIVLAADYDLLQAENEALRNTTVFADAARCDYIRNNPYRAIDIFEKSIDVNRPALWNAQFNDAIDKAKEQR